jgi:hypothetical protein
LASASEKRARHRLRIELWSWSAWLILGIVSYPALLLIWIAPRAGLLAGLMTGLLVAYTASLGYSARKELERWFALTLLALVAGAAAAALALYADRVPTRTAVLCALIVVAEMTFAWNFLPWLVRDADAAEPAPALQPHLLGRGASSREAVRPALGLVLMLALLALGLGSAWVKGEARVPNPTVWIVALGLLCLAFMFVERMAFFERAAREGNLLMAPGSYRSWLSLALVVLLLSAALAAVLPLRQAKREAPTSHLGSAFAPSAAQSAADRLAAAASAISAATRRAAAGVSAMPRAAFSLLLLLLLLLLALVLIWVSRRSRLGSWLLRAAAALLALAARAWHRCRELVVRLLHRRQPPSARVAQPQQADPLRDVFAEPDGLAGLSAREIAIRTYHLLLNFADMLGHGRGHAQTPFEYARALQAVAPSAAQSVLALTWAYSGAMYGGEWAEPTDPSAVREWWERVSAALTGDMAEEELALRRRAYLATRRIERARQ